MAMNKILHWIGRAVVSLAVVATPSCSKTTSPGDAAVAADAENEAPEPIIARARQKSLESVLVFLPDSPNTRELWAGLEGELSEEFNVIPHIMRGDTSQEEMANAIATSGPSCLILVNNPTVRLYREYQQGHGAGKPVLPAVIVMASFLDEVAPQVNAATGIAYEVPLLTSVVNLRTFIDRQVARVGVVHRAPFGRFVDTQRKLASVEGIEIVAEVVPDDASSADLRSAVRRLRRKQGVDAIWVLNDNSLLNQELIVSGWIPGLTGGDAVPVIVGVPTLVHPDIHFGTFAMLPDHEALGLQTANMVYDLADNDWDMEGFDVKLPLSVQSVVDVAAARADLGFREEALVQIDRVVE